MGELELGKRVLLWGWPRGAGGSPGGVPRSAVVSGHSQFSQSSASPQPEAALRGVCRLLLSITDSASGTAQRRAFTCPIAGEPLGVFPA